MLANDKTPELTTSTSPFQVLPSVASILEMVTASGSVPLAGDALTTAVSDAVSTVRERIASGERNL